MTKATTGFLAVGARTALCPVATRIARKMREHSEQMAAPCEQTVVWLGGRGEAVTRT